MSKTKTEHKSPQTTPYKPMRGKIIATKQYTTMEKFFRIELEGKQELNHMPGQFVEVSLFGIGEAPISICSSPTDKGYFDLTVRNAGMVTGALHKLGKGDLVGIRGPYGRGFPVEKFFGNDILIVAGGLGIVPLRGLIRYLDHYRKDFGDIQILLGCKSPKEMLYPEEMKQWSRHNDIQFNCTVDKGDPDWKGNVGLITSLIPGVSINPMRTYAVVVGPPIMYKFVLKELIKLEIPEKQIIMSLERRMKCGIGRCGHCQINGKYTCKEGPVFSYEEIKDSKEALE